MGSSAWAFREQRILVAACLLATFPSTEHRASAPTQTGIDVVRNAAANLTIPFEQNIGQFEAEVAFKAQTFTATVFVTTDGRLVYSLPLPRGEEYPSTSAARPGGWALSETLVGAAPLNPVGSGQGQAKVARFQGNDRSRWITRIPSLSRVHFGEAWPGIDVSLTAHGGWVEKIFTVLPRGDAAHIRVRVDGAPSIRLDNAGALVAQTGLGDIQFSKPVAFQAIEGEKRRVEVAYAVSGNEYGFQLGIYDPEFPVVIDPILQSTYLGGTGQDNAGSGTSIAISPTTGEVYVTGSTLSTDFPGTVGGVQASKNGTSDAFIARLSSSLDQFYQVTYLGGSSADGAYSIAIDSNSDDVYITGFTGSQNFPGTTGGAQPTAASNTSLNQTDIFVARLNGALTTLRQSTYLGGSGTNETGKSIAVNSSNGDVYVTGLTDTVGFPGSSGGAQASPNGGEDFFISRFNSSLTALLQSTYVGGAGNEGPEMIAIGAANGDVYVVGNTSSADFPSTAGGAQTSLAGTRDAFVMRLSSTLTSFQQSTYLGGSRDEIAMAFAINPSTGDVYVTGNASTGTDFPGTAGGAQSAHAPMPPYVGDGFVARLNGALTSLLQATYLGGSAGGGNESGDSIAVSSATGDVFVAGVTSSTDFPGTANGAQATANASNDAFVARMNSELTSLEQATYFGGSSNDYAVSTAISASTGQIYLFGGTQSGDIPAINGGAQTVPANNIELFLTRITVDLLGDTVPDTFSFTDQTGAEPGAAMTSNIVSISGIDNPASISVVGGAYSIGCGATFTATSGTINNGQSVCVRQTASSSFSTSVDTTLTVGGVSDTFTSTTRAIDTIPDAFGFTNQTGVEPNATVTSDTVTISGIDAPVSISITGGLYSIGCSASFTSASSTIGNGQSVCVRHTASSSFSASVDTTLTVGGVFDTFTSTTRAIDTIPNAFGFMDQAGVEPGATVTSDTVTISGIDAPVAISVTGGLYSIGCTASFTAANGAISNGQAVCVRHTASSLFSSSVSTILTVGGVADSFASTTKAAPPPSGSGGGGGAMSVTALLSMLLALRRRKGERLKKLAATFVDTRL